jgi:hypothetical protein
MIKNKDPPRVNPSPRRKDLQLCVPRVGDALLADLQIGIDDATQYVVLIMQIVQYVCLLGVLPAQRACHDRGSDLVLGMCNYGGLIDTLFTDVEGVAKICCVSPTPPHVWS